MKYLDLFDGEKMPSIGLGTWKSDPEVLKKATQLAINTGYKHFDCAAIYQNEPAIGDALNHALTTHKVSRDQLWVTSKLWNSYHRPEDVLSACKATLKALRLDYLDLYLMHWPVAFAPHVGLALADPDTADDFLSLDQAPISDTWQAMEQLVSSGLVRYIGVSNFSQTKLKKLLPQTIIHPAVNQIESHPFLAQSDLVDYCTQNKILVTAYSPLGSGDRPAAHKGQDEPSLLSNKTVLSIANAHSRTAAQVLLAWQIQRGIAVIPKSTNEARMAENLAALEVQLSASEMAQISKLDKNYRYINGTFWEGKGSPYTAVNIFD